METLTVALGERSYPIHVGRALLRNADLITPHLRQAKAAIVTNSTVADLYLQSVAEPLRGAGVEVIEIILPDGEEFKDWPTLNLIFDALLQRRCERSTTLIALGGGVVGDITGFAAACYQRGVPFLQVPTSLLAQVDSSVGGKTAINHPLGKNMLGAFHQPVMVLADTDTLATLPDRQLSAGLAEVIKYGLIRDLPFLEWIERNVERLLARDAPALAEAICRSCANKAEVVAADERESGERALLNLGHTFGHAIETGVGYGQWLHGEAVAAGIMMAVELSALLGWLASEDVERIERLLLRAELPVHGAPLTVDRYLELMQHDKKVEDGQLRLVLVPKLGTARLVSGIRRAMIEQAIRRRCTNA
ncbi:MAG TPA: 3-dehydroquinate synthase [Accumulibacter sp.]|uniref:3-dehydroquinate synthase n=1 Tax=Accumulibacter sp. TaxID=2053492 RepID=UPI002BD5789A|nr:3-dehydroquinate synthase [Accumulibacter sp.]HMV04048.1 3-dehydroquinate synthase [Accumulibacter sp.]HMW62624.1 3-dehydroquinate synthase [Accumulibacter sp.]HMW80054.1 3-dehydroquinate synthase [Accumulibacter sp.]HMX68913.1 3-dehydroquinate synthase [Accumulibacter sp.]HND38047.1 3-dehydroquinate synthase [Accumulibacter sp.]